MQASEKHPQLGEQPVLERVGRMLINPKVRSRSDVSSVVLRKRVYLADHFQDLSRDDQADYRALMHVYRCSRRCTSRGGTVAGRDEFDPATPARECFDLGNMGRWWGYNRVSAPP